jgi:hypothetical protein
MRFERELPDCLAAHRVAENRWAVVSPDGDPYQPATHVIRVVTEESFAPAQPAIVRRLRLEFMFDPNSINAKRAAAARRARRARARRKAGMAVFSLPLPVKRLERVVRERERLPANAPVTKQQIHRALIDGISWWSTPWITSRRVTRDGSG